ncbi:MAG: fibronectin type III domain-containing protein [Candidatus Woesearchaeota archaeon]
MNVSRKQANLKNHLRRAVITLSFLSIFIFIMSLSSSGKGCCIVDDLALGLRPTFYDDVSQDECNDLTSPTIFFESTSCQDSSLAYYTMTVCCKITANNQELCYYGSKNLINMQIASLNLEINEENIKCDISQQPENCIKENQEGECAENSNPRCTPGCMGNPVGQGVYDSPLFCTEKGDIISNCTYCGGCGGLQCGSDGMCYARNTTSNCTAPYQCCDSCSENTYPIADRTCADSTKVCCEQCASTGGGGGNLPSQELLFYGYVKNSTRGAIEGAYVVVVQAGVGAVTDKNGYYEIKKSNLTKDYYDLVAYKSSYSPASKQNMKVGDEVNFTLYSSTDPACNNPKVSNLKAEPVQGRTDIQLSWETACDPQIAYYEVNRSIKSGSSFTLEKSLKVLSKSYTDAEDLRWNTTYKYAVTAVYYNGGRSAPNSTTITTGSQLCEGVFPMDEFCIEKRSGQLLKNTPTANLRYSCNSSNEPVSNELLVYKNSSNSQYATLNCSEISANTYCALEKRDAHVGTKCVQPDECRSSGNPLGLFYSKDSCDSKSCYYDFSQTTIDACYSCRANLRCSEFLSKEACLNNNCGIQCNWTDTIKELNMGICYSVPPEGNCDRCNSLFSGCTPEACSLLGSCKMEDGTCKSCSEIQNLNCTMYKSREECEGNPSYSEFEYCPEGQPVRTNATTDSCKKLRCVWDAANSICLKDANFDGKNDCTREEFALTERCLLDNTPPVTNVTSWNYDANTNKLTVNFNFSETVREFGYCISKEPNCCPDNVTSWNIDTTDIVNYSISKRDLTERGVYYLRYYAVDDYYNQESLQTYKIVITFADDSLRLPDNLIYFYTPSENKYNLSVMARLNKEATCTFTIDKDAQQKVKSSTFSREAQEFQVNFEGLNYSNYLFTLSCQKGSNRLEKSYNLYYLPNVKVQVQFPDSIILEGLPMMGKGEYRVWLNFTQPVTLNSVGYALNNGDYNETISNFITADNTNFEFKIVIVPSITHQSKLYKIRQFAHITLNATTSDNTEITEANAANSHFKINTRAPSVLNVTVE